MFTARLSEAVRREEMRELIRAHPLGNVDDARFDRRSLRPGAGPGGAGGHVASVEVLARAADLADVNDLHLGAAAQELVRLGPAGAAQAGRWCRAR